MVETLSIGPYKLKTVPLYNGPLLEAAGESEPIALLLNHAVASGPADLAHGIVNKEQASDAIVFVKPATTEEDDRVLRDQWASKTGENLNSGEVATVGQAGREGLAVSWAALQKGLAELQSIRNHWQPEPGPWLFVRPTRRPFVTPDDFKVIDDLEKEAAAIDEMDSHVEVGHEPSALIIRRMSFLLECQNAGVFSSDHGEVREQWLNNWSAFRLIALRRAAMVLKAWGFLDESQEPTDGRVCLDYVRLQLWPTGEDGESWARSALKLLPPFSEDDQGAVLERIESMVSRIWWRRDGELPALLAIARD